MILDWFTRVYGHCLAHSLRYMKRNFLFLFSLLCVLTSSVFAQLSIGVQGGYTKNYLYTRVGPFINTKYEPVDGISLGLSLQYAVTDWFALQSEVQFVQKNYRLTRTGFQEGIYNTTTNQYGQLPIMGHFSFGGRQLKGFLNLGGYAGYWMTSRQQGIMANIDNNLNAEKATRLLDDLPPLAYDESYVFDARKDRRLDVGWLAGVGLTYQPGRYQFFVEGRYTQAMLDQQKPYAINQQPRYNQTFLVQIGGLYQLNRRH